MSTENHLITTYRSLPDGERRVMQLLSLILVPVTRTTLAECLLRAGIRNERGKGFSTRELLPLLEKLGNGGLIHNSQNGYLCHTPLLHPLTRELDQQGDLKRLAEAIRSVLIRPASYTYYASYQHYLQDLRLAIYLRDVDNVNRLLTFGLEKYRYEFNRQHPVLQFFPEPLDREWLLSMPVNLLIWLLCLLNDHAFTSLKPSTAFDILEHFVKTAPEASLPAHYCYYLHLLFRGRLRDAEHFLKGAEIKQRHPELEGLLLLLRGDIDGAIPHFEQGIALRKKETGKRKICFNDILCLFHMLALVRSDTPRNLKTAVELGELVTKQRQHPQLVAIWMLHCLAQVKLGNNRFRQDLEQACNHDGYELDPLSRVTHSLVAFWMPPVKANIHIKPLNGVIDGARTAGFHWIAAEAALLKKSINPNGKNIAGDAEKLFQEEGYVSMSGYAAKDKEWERSLKSLLALGSDSPHPVDAPKQSRLLWAVWSSKDMVGIQPLEQKLSVRGWTKGRNVALKRLYEDNVNMDFLTPQDRKAVACISKERGYGYYASYSYEFDTFKALCALIGHPLVINDKTGEPLTIAEGRFTLSARRSKGKVTITLVPPLNNQVQAYHHWEGGSRLVLYEPTPEQLRISAIIGNGLVIPESAEQQIAAAITAVAPHVVVHSDVSGDNAGAETVEADSRLWLTLRPSGSGLGIEARIFPFGENGPGFTPGKGGATVIAEVGGKRLQACRDHELERNRFDSLMKTSASLELLDSGDNSWRLEQPEDALLFLEGLRNIMNSAPDAYVAQWPEGEHLKIRGTASWDRLKLSLRSGKEWFSLEGEVKVSEDDVLSLRQLLELLDSGPGRFIRLADGEFVALTEEFRRRLEDLRRMMARNGKEQRFHPLMAPLVEESLSGTGGIRGDKRWKACLERFREADQLKPKLPATLRATLRDYQQEGFEWLGRLAHWGVGACLADDMGLGKTIQALALLINRAPAGPALALAPTSVCLNWENEARRFAPTLNPRIFGSGDRKKFIDELGPFDLVICSYTLFQLEEELLTPIRWETVVLDEAQAIKNMTTKRSQAAMRLNAGFRLATTGTPVENRLDELWNLFRFLNPGLLGSHREFGERFATPIERDGDKNARALLKRLIRPFILRRTKSAVLEELPPRTDIVQRVELSGEEGAFYEALRRRALDNLQETEGQPPGERQIRILAEIMRLRRACCNPLLIMPGSGIASSKLAAFCEIVDELRDNGHRALVFSQFVDHLAILRAELDGAGISYQYLDGATPVKQRQESVTAFQSGQGDLFLISLKAGGTGLNLTAADYVIHMDPWWNPAVEDQASDRAHRIGQQRPVTVYRLVAANTIEEKIVALHHQKRELADSLLEGTDTAARVSAEDLLELLRES